MAPPHGHTAPAHLGAADLALVFTGGALGVLARALVNGWIPTGAWPWATLAVNLTGAALLGALVGVVPGRHTRLVVGTGLLGAFTTYSALALEVGALATRPALALGYATATLVGGLALAIVGVRLTGRVVRR